MNENEKVSLMIVDQTYVPPHFMDKDRLAKVEALFPEIDEMYGKYAKKIVTLVTPMEFC